jgi:hypothetical protein
VKLFFLILCCCGPTLAQRFSVGVEGGLPLTSTSDTGQEDARYGGQTAFQIKRYTVGPTIEIGLPFGLRVEADALYKHALQDLFYGPAPTGNLVQEAIRMNIWEIPLLLKYQWKTHGLQPFAAAGSTLRRVEDLDIDEVVIPDVPNYPNTRQQFTVSSGEPIRYGVTFGAGLIWKLSVLRLEPELRYTHWTAKHWMATTEQIEFLLGVKFPVGR